MMLRKKGWTLQRIATLMGVTKERIRQREAKHHRRHERRIEEVARDLQQVELQCIAWVNFVGVK